MLSWMPIYRWHFAAEITIKPLQLISIANDFKVAGFDFGIKGGFTKSPSF